MEGLDFTNAPEKYLPLRALSGLYGISVGSLKQLLHAAKRQGIPLPERRRIRRQFFYDRVAFNLWIWQHAAELKSDFPEKLKINAEDVD